MLRLGRLSARAAYERGMDEFQEVSAAELASERQASLPRLHIVAQSSSFPLLELGDRQFEQLARDLLAANAGKPSGYDRATLLREGADRGRDIILYNDGRLAGIIQCKRKASSLGITEIRRELLKYCLFAVRDPAISPRGMRPHYQVWTASSLTETARTFFDDADVRAETLRGLSPDEFDPIRAKYSSLAEPDEERAQRDASAAIRLAQRLELTHVGPSEIYAMLRDEDAIRRAYFRSPYDSPPHASVGEVTSLLDSRRRSDLIHYAEAGAAGSHPYVARASIDDAFADFLTEASRLFVLVGGSGQGKTSWAAHLAEKPPADWSVHIVRAEDIAESDQNLIETLKRDMEARPTGGIPSRALMQALWSWIDGGNHIFIIDGLDRVRSAARDTLPRWLGKSELLTRDHSVRLVVTSRRESWATIDEELQWQPPHLHSPGKSRTSVELGALTAGEAQLIYDAYGVTTKQHSGRPLDSPSLIRRFARLKSGQQGEVVTRYDVLSADFAAMLTELGKSPGATKVAAEILMRALGSLLLDYPDGWVPIAALATVVEGAPAVLDALLKSDRATMREGKIRLESDDMIEQVIGRGLTPETVRELLKQQRDEPLVIGGIAMMLARMEKQSVGEARELLDGWLASAPTGRSAALDAAARSLLEVRAPHAFIGQATAAVAGWRQMNLILGLSQLGDMIASIALPAVVRLQIMWPLVAMEDKDDWRSKYWFDPGLGGRIVNAFSVAAEQAARESGDDVLAFLIDRIDDTNETSRAAARYLLHVAAEAAPEAALALCWRAPRDGFDTAFAIAALSAPGPAARFLGGTQAASASTEELVTRLYEQAWSVPMGRVRPPAPDDVLLTLEQLLPRADDPRLETLLLITALRFQPDDVRRKRLLELWAHVDTSDYWRAISLLTAAEQERLLVDLIDGGDAQHDRAYLLGNLAAHNIDNRIHRTVIAHLGALYRKEPSLAYSVAQAVEGMLYAIMPNDDVGNRLFELALDIARGPDDGARLMLLYYAGSEQRGDADDADVERREAILTRLVETETGANLDVLIWKIAESAHERPDAIGHAIRLVDRLGEPEVFEATHGLGSMDYMRELRDAITRRLEERRKAAKAPDMNSGDPATDAEEAETDAPGAKSDEDRTDDPEDDPGRT